MTQACLPISDYPFMGSKICSINLGLCIANRDVSFTFGKKFALHCIKGCDVLRFLDLDRKYHAVTVTVYGVRKVAYIARIFKNVRNHNYGQPLGL